MTSTQQFIPDFLNMENNGTSPAMLGSGFPGGSMYGTNFIDILFKHIMESGLEGLSLLALLQLYFYLSLDRIKDLFKYFNDKLAEHGKVKLELWCGWIGTLFNTWVEGSFIKCWEVCNNLFQRAFSGKKSRNNKGSNDFRGFGPGIPVAPRGDGKTRYVLGLESQNRVDVMSICNYVLQERERLGINDICTRTETSKRHTEELFTLPSELDISLADGVGIRFVQNVNLAMLCESNHLDEETVKDYVLGSEVLKTSISLRTLEEFTNLLGEILDPLSPLQDDDGKNLHWPPLVVHNWSSNPACITNGGEGSKLEKFWTLVYLSRSSSLLESVIRFMAGSDSFTYGGKEYMLTEPFWDNMSASKEINSSSGIKELRDFLDESYRKSMIELLEELEHPIAQEYQTAAQGLVQQHEAKPDTEDPMYIEFSSEDMTEFELDNYGREWMHQRIQSYYQDNMQRDGDKINIFKMYIQYKKEQIEVSNPDFQDWLDKHGLSEEEYDKLKEEEEEKKQKEEDEKKKKEKEGGDEEEGESKSKSKKKKSEDDDDSSEDTSSKKKKSKKKKKKQLPSAVPGYYGMGGMGGAWTGGAYYGHPPRQPVVPPKTIKRDKLIPKCKTKLIKKDRKPLEYLYLPHETMDSLVKYLKNFKNNRERYEKFGLPYRGGILLSGVPGCGKSSTVLATATFLKKDIYYLDLGAIKTNEELKLCVDHIRNNSKNGGVIIFEDIDCMTDIVLRRGDGRGYDGSGAANGSITAATSNNGNGNNTTSNIANNNDCDALSLSFLLNVLDGTMAPEDVIFMMTTNRKHMLDPALIRPGRIDLSFYVGRCTRYQLVNIYKDLYDKNLPADLVERFPEDKWITAKVILHLFHNSFNSNLDAHGLIKQFLE